MKDPHFVFVTDDSGEQRMAINLSNVTKIQFRKPTSGATADVWFVGTEAENKSMKFVGTAADEIEAAVRARS